MSHGDNRMDDLSDEGDSQYSYYQRTLDRISKTSEYLNKEQQHPTLRIEPRISVIAISLSSNQMLNCVIVIFFTA